MDHSGESGRTVIRTCSDFRAALALAAAAGLEVSPDAAEPLALWGAYRGGQLVGVVSLDDHEGLPVVGWIAVTEAERGRGLGERLLAAVEREARRRGAGTLWATARTPGFFLALGYEPVDAGEERERLLADCEGCPQLSESCRPRAVRRLLGPPAG
jgi:N-acetylglutamate synthase-like GNAT family acetyltransferase